MYPSRNAPHAGVCENDGPWFGRSLKGSQQGTNRFDPVEKTPSKPEVPLGAPSVEDVRKT